MLHPDTQQRGGVTKKVKQKQALIRMLRALRVLFWKAGTKGLGRCMLEAARPNYPVTPA
jgi:hypothetical protein